MSEEVVQELISSTREQFQARLDELRPSVEAYHQIEGILASFDGTKTRKPSRRGTTATADRAERGQRPGQFMEIVRDNPGISVGDAAKLMEGVSPNYLYRIARDLSNAGALRKEDKGYFVTVGE